MGFYTIDIAVHSSRGVSLCSSSKFSHFKSVCNRRYYTDRQYVQNSDSARNSGKHKLGLLSADSSQPARILFITLFGVVTHLWETPLQRKIRGAEGSL